MHPVHGQTLPVLLALMYHPVTYVSRGSWQGFRERLKSAAFSQPGSLRQMLGLIPGALRAGLMGCIREQRAEVGGPLPLPTPSPLHEMPLDPLNLFPVSFY